MSESKNYSVELKWVVIFVFVQLTWFVGEKFLGLHSENIANHALYTNLFAIPTLLLYYSALAEKKRTAFGGVMTWKEAFKSGMAITLGIAITSPIVQLIFHFGISPEYFDNAIGYAVENNLSTQADAMRYFALTNYLIISSVSSFFLGLVVSLITALVVSSK